ncbi:prefoldin 2 [Wolffia australiana]
MSSLASGSSGEPPMNEQMIIGIYNNLRSEINQLHAKITELEMEVSEHSLVIAAVEPLDPSRRCYRMIGGVLVERTVREVLPAVRRNKEGLEEVISRLYEALERKKKEMSEFEVRHGIKIRRSEMDKKDPDAPKEGSSAGQGVLVGPAGV